MNPDQFLEVARVLPEPVLMVTSQGEILSLNQAVVKLLNCNRKDLKGKTLWELVKEPQEQVLSYLEVCARSRQLALGSLTFLLPQEKTLMCRVEGAVMQPASADSPALNLLRLQERAAANSEFLTLNHKIAELSEEVRHRQKIEAELREKNDELKQAMEQLKNTQLQLIQTEKMSSLGQLVAGIAHEINNPISFIHGNLTHAEEYCQDLLNLVQLYQTEYPHPSPNIQEHQAEIDLDFIQTDLESLLKSMKMGTTRILGIVKSLRNFSRLDESEVKEVDIHEGIESTLVILKNRLMTPLKGGKIQLIRDYGNLPLVDCYPSQLNQVFMNLISNAIDALMESVQERTLEEIERNPSQIRIQTRVIENSRVHIAIQDNGLGICEKVCPRIFDPFFTTKPIGKGTGLGLSISYQIITQLHQGQLICNSKSGQGTILTVEIPIRRDSSEPKEGNNSEETPDTASKNRQNKGMIPYSLV